MRRNVPLVIAFSVGVVLLAQYFNPALFDLYEISLVWLPIIAGIVAFLGVISFAMHHWVRAKRKAKDWLFSWAALIAFAAMVFSGVWGRNFGNVPPEVPPTWPAVSFEDHPDDAGGVLDQRLKLVNRVGDVRGFSVYRKRADEPDSDFVKIREVRGDEYKIGKAVENRDNNGRPHDSVLANGDFEEGLTGWTAEGAETGSDAYRGGFAVLSAGGSVVTPPIPIGKDQRYRLAAIARSPNGEGAIRVEVVAADGRVLKTFDTDLENDEWVDVVPRGLEHDVLPPADTDVSAALRFTAVDAEVRLDDVTFRPLEVEFVVENTDAAPYNDNPDFPHYGEMRDLMTTTNSTFDISLAGWEGEGVTRVERTDLLKKNCARVPAGAAFLSPRLDRPKDPMGHRLQFRLRSWGRGVTSPLKAEVVFFDGDREVPPPGANSIEWPADGEWVKKEVLVEPPEKFDGIRLRYTATGASGYAEVDDMELLAVKMAPVVGQAYVYKVAALNADGGLIDEVVSKPVSGKLEIIGTFESRYGLYNWLFRFMLVPMEATMFALLAFFIASAAFRAFRARSLEATLLLAAAIFVMIGRVPVGDYIWEPLGTFADWIMQYPNGAAKRAIMIGVGLGMAATSLKLMLGLERAYLGRG